MFNILIHLILDSAINQINYTFVDFFAFMKKMSVITTAPIIKGQL